MKSLSLREAKSHFSAVVDAAERGQATTITRRGRPAAVVMPVESAARLAAVARPSFFSLLATMPIGVDFPRDRSPSRGADL
jgi:prevent-host-death family protein